MSTGTPDPTPTPLSREQLEDAVGELNDCLEVLWTRRAERLEADAAASQAAAAADVARNQETTAYGEAQAAVVRVRELVEQLGGG